MSDGHYSTSQKAAPWVTVAVLITGALIVAAAIIVGSWPLAIAGIAVIVLCLITAAVLQQSGSAASVSFEEEFPHNTVGPRATSEGDSAPPINTGPSTAGERPSR